MITSATASLPARLKFSANQLKVLALILMLFEHVTVNLHQLMPAGLPLIAEYAGRIVAPIFFYLAVESYFKTSNRRRFVTRLYLWAAVMAAGNYVMGLIVRQVFKPERFFPLGQNIFLSIAVGVSMVAAFEWSRTESGRKWQGIALGVFFTLLGLITESNYLGVVCFLIFYFFRQKPGRMALAYSLFCIVLAGWGWFTNPTYFWSFEFQWMMIAALPFLMLYSGERGTANLKYLFYVVYPLHLWILYFVRHFWPMP